MASSSSPSSGEDEGCSGGVCCSETPRSTGSSGQLVEALGGCGPAGQVEGGWGMYSAMPATSKNPWRGGEKEKRNT